MDIGTVIVERTNSSSSCGLLTARDAYGETRIWWSVERLDDHRVRIGFVQGSRTDWLEFVELHAPALSDAILAAMAHRGRLAMIA